MVDKQLVADIASMSQAERRVLKSRLDQLKSSLDQYHNVERKVGGLMDRIVDALEAASRKTKSKSR